LAFRHGYQQFDSIVSFDTVVMRSRLNHHRRDANDGGGASARTGTDYRHDNIGDSSADKNLRNTPDMDRNRRARHIYQSTLAPSLFEARKQQTQALTELAEDIFS
jgi:hypothetical protein